MSLADLHQAAEFAALRATAARLGKDPLQIQGPGGNVSIKSDGDMLVKASGTWLSDAMEQDIFAPVDAAAMAAALRASDPSADKPAEFLLAEGLRPSIETSFHAALDAPVVLHTHCVATLARSTAPLSAAELNALKLVFVPYFKPGAELAREVLKAWQPDAVGAVLGNHGLIVVGDTVAEAEARLDKVSRHFNTGSVPQHDPDPELVKDLQGTGWSALGSGATTALAFNPEALATLTGPALFPDQVIFLGPEPFATDLPVAPPPGPPASLAMFPCRGAAVPENASPACVALAEMMGEVVFRLPETPTRLTLEQTLSLLDWDAEKYRQVLENERTARLAGGPQ
ncbi:class II aldolase/adducin family protein [Roseibium sp. MMSF_3544]|uniref:class II aldolase/adducin family protein n=1 Tax=unclassified Roseibium TaxID=2629323 RepID=UPI00273DDF04|nr:class II aldolase/adducin family protein [Roseibium sp. MMSF_3544]